MKASEKFAGKLKALRKALLREQGLRVTFTTMKAFKKGYYYSFLKYVYIRVGEKRLPQNNLSVYLNFKKLNTWNKLLVGISHEVTHYLQPRLDKQEFRREWLKNYKRMKFIEGALQ